MWVWVWLCLRQRLAAIFCQNLLLKFFCLPPPFPHLLSIFVCVLTLCQCLRLADLWGSFCGGALVFKMMFCLFFVAVIILACVSICVHGDLPRTRIILFCVERLETRNTDIVEVLPCIHSFIHSFQPLHTV